ncbi:MAG: hypothetical protein ACYC3I_07740 [Gemmataceae bacterium]
MSASSPTISIDFVELDKAVHDAPNWAVLEETLYGLCRRFPDHADRAGSNAKLWLIGRGLATGVERQIKSTGGQGSAMQTLCEHVYQNRSQVDDIIGRLREAEEPLNEKNLETVVREHGKFCHLLSPILNKKSPRSFAAKYLHCHCPALPIYDSVASYKLRWVCPWEDGFQLFKQPEEADEKYYWFALWFLPLYRAARELRPGVTVRLLDLYLLW